MKKFISIVLCLCMILSMALCASAADSKYVYVALGDEIAAGDDQIIAVQPPGHIVVPQGHAFFIGDG